MSIVKARVRARALLREVVQSTPMIKQASIVSSDGWPIVTWPWKSVLRAARFAAMTPEIVVRSDSVFTTFESAKLEYIPVQLPNGQLLITFVDGRLYLNLYSPLSHFSSDIVRTAAETVVKIRGIGVLTGTDSA